jgi:hypothetical protein
MPEGTKLNLGITHTQGATRLLHQCLITQTQAGGNQNI